MMCRYANRYYFEEGSETFDAVLDIHERCASASMSDEVIALAVVAHLAAVDAELSDEERARRVAAFVRQQGPEKTFLRGAAPSRRCSSSYMLH